MENNSILNDELILMRKQLSVLKDKVKKQEIINEKTLKRTLSNKSSQLMKDNWKLVIMGLLGVASYVFLFYSLKFSIAFSCFTIIALVASIGIQCYVTRELSPSVIINSDTREVYRKAMKLRKFNKMWLYRIGIPFLIIWIPWIAYELSNVVEDKRLLTGYYISGCIGGIIGGIAGIRMYRRHNKIAEDIMDITKDDEDDKFSEL